VDLVLFFEFGDGNEQNLLLSIGDGMIAKGQMISSGWQKDGVLVVSTCD
jgi:hypothetical protein